MSTVPDFKDKDTNNKFLIFVKPLGQRPKNLTLKIQRFFVTKNSNIGI